MSIMTDEELRRLDERIDNVVAGHPLFRRERPVALYHLLLVLEEVHRLVPSRPEDVVDHFRGTKRYRDGIHFAVKWVSTHCPVTKHAYQLSLDDRAWTEACDLLEVATSYSLTWDVMSLLRRELAEGEIDAKGTKVRYRDKEWPVPDAHVADHIIGGPDDPLALARLPDDGLVDRTNEVLSGVRVKSSGWHFSYTLRDSQVSALCDIQRQGSGGLWELGEDWDLGGYTVADFHEAWLCLNAEASAHVTLAARSGAEGAGIESILRIQSRERWIRDLARRAKLNWAAAASILRDLTCDPVVHCTGLKSSDVAYRPFIPMWDEFCAASNALIMLSNPERNIWDLVSVLRPGTHDRLKGKKEALWRDQLVPRLEGRNLRCGSDIHFTHQGEGGQIDLIIVDPDDAFAVICEMKWPTAPDRIRTVAARTGELSKGITQARKAREWADSNKAELATKLGWDAHDIEGVEFQGAVLSKNTLGSGWLEREDVPVLNDRLLEYVLFEPHRRSLRDLWRVAHTRSYYPQRGKHFEIVDQTFSIGDIHFVGEGAGQDWLQLWDPVSDIRWPS